MSTRAFVAFEGCDGSGKSTQAALLAERVGAVLTRQPGGSPLGERLRSLVLDAEHAPKSRRAEALLFMADRAEHVETVVRPALVAGRDVVSDRWTYSTVAYQGYGMGLDVEELESLSEWATLGLKPDRVILIDVSAELAHERQVARGKTSDHFEAEGIALQHRVIAGYRDMANQDATRWRVVDGSGTPDAVAQRVWASLSDLFPPSEWPS